MSDATLDDRLVELETRLAFQEHSLGELSDALADLRSENARLVLMLHRALDELRQIRAGLSTDLTGDPGLEPPPPHY
ncbi:protein SlyX [Lysobacter xinjiangensis]|uniref:Protein SlyX homolog n=1 Tax=Cognatilysobacter xinjiangensis TaxID=546892 RepID=A0ABQ3BUM6_9GAMM|nr:SlyX family protein [Lysobacter xinjiangensis]GGZ58165.1 protein SlyX [Lysobacter xinjiangensis]